MQVNFDSPQKITICGFNGTGKTTLVKWMIKNYKQPVFAYDWHGEYKDLPNVFYYVPRFKPDFEKRRMEFDESVKNFFIKKQNIFKVMVIDEANEYEPNGMDMTSAFQDEYDNHRHYGQTVVCLVRRPTDLNTSFIETSHQRIFFKLFGKNDLQYMEQLKLGLGDIVSNLQQFQFAILDSFGKVTVCNPIPF